MDFAAHRGAGNRARLSPKYLLTREAMIAAISAIVYRTSGIFIFIDNVARGDALLGDMKIVFVVGDLAPV